MEARVAAEAKLRAEEECKRQRVADEKAAKLQERREALRLARAQAIGEFRAKTLSKEGLKSRNAEFEAEANAIDREERGELEEKEVEEEKEELVEGLPVIRMRKRKAVVVDDEGEEECDELDEEATGGEIKRARLDMVPTFEFEGPVSVLTMCFEPTNVKVAQPCVVAEGAAKCTRCTKNLWGCWWGGLSIRGTRQGESKKGKSAVARWETPRKTGKRFRSSLIRSC
jgi:hypothetical protein